MVRVYSDTVGVVCCCRFRSLFLEVAKTDEAKLAVLKALAEFYANNPQVCEDMHYVCVCFTYIEVFLRYIQSGYKIRSDTQVATLATN